MVDPVITGAAITAGGALLGGMMGGRGPSLGSQLNQFSLNRAAQKKTFAFIREREDSYVQRRVADAKAAGIHPLFALGPGGSTHAPSFTVGGQSPSGSQMGPAIARAAGAVGRGVASSGIAKIALERQQVALERDQVELLKSMSELKRMEQTAISGPVYQDFDQAEVHPLGTKAGPKLNVTSQVRKSVATPTGAVEMRDRWTPQHMRALQDRYGDEAVEWLIQLPLYIRERLLDNPRSYFHQRVKSGRRKRGARLGPKQFNRYWESRIIRGKSR